MLIQCASPLLRERDAFLTHVERFFVGGAIIAILGITSVPYLFAYLTAPPDKQFMGILVNVPDHAQYFSWFRQYLTANLARNLLTSEPNAPIFFNLLWWMLAKVGALLGWDYAAMFQVLRVAATVAFLLMLYRLCAWFLDDRLQRQVAFLMAVFASGFGWLLVVGKYLFGWEYPLEINLLIYIVEPNSFYAMLSTPHLTSAALYMFAFDLILRGEAKGQLRYAVWAGLFVLFLGFQHAYDLFLVYGILSAYGLLKIARDRRVPSFLVKAGPILGLLSFWPGLYSFLLTSLDPIWREVLAQFDNAGVFTPNPFLLPVLMGPAFLLALFTLLRDNPFRLTGLDDKGLFLRAWFWMNVLLIYLPTDYQIKMLNGWQAPIAILATQGLFRYVLPWVEHLSVARAWRWRGEALRRGLAIAALACVVPTNLYLYAWRFVDLSRYTYPYYLSRAELEAMNWLATQARPDSVVLSSLTLGQYIPALTGQRAFLAHWAQTVDYYTKERVVNEFFEPGSSSVRRHEILREYGIDFVLFSSSESAGRNLSKISDGSLKAVFVNASTVIYLVQSR